MLVEIAMIRTILNNLIKLQMYISIGISNNNILLQKKDKNPDDCVDLISVHFTIMRAKVNRQSPKKWI